MKYIILVCCILPLLNCCGMSNEKSLENSVMTNTEHNSDTVTLAGGCFWCIEAVFQRLNGVLSVSSGYCNGKIANPTYKEVCSGLTGHAEAVQIAYDPAVVSFAEILKVFFTVHDPTTLNRQGGDVGTQYRSGIYFHTDEQRKTATEIIAELEKQKIYAQPIVTEVLPLEQFYKAEDYHQDYFNQNKNSNPYCTFVIVPKLEKFEKVFKDKMKH